MIVDANSAARCSGFAADRGVMAMVLQLEQIPVELLLEVVKEELFPMLFLYGCLDALPRT